MIGLPSPRNGWRTAALRVGLAALSLAACERGPDPKPPVPLVYGGDASVGVSLVERYGCKQCHTIPGLQGAHGKVGPPLTDFAYRSYIAGNLDNSPENLVAWIMNPQAVEPGTAMPNLGVTEAQARHIAAYLYTLR